MSEHRPTRWLPARRTSAPGRVLAERASALVLVPAMALVVIALAAIAVDLSMLHAAHRSVHRSVSAAADDAAAMIDLRQVQVTGELRVDPEAARRVAAAHLDAATLPGELVGLRTDVDTAGLTVTVTATVVVRHVVLPVSASTNGEEPIVVSARARVRG